MFACLQGPNSSVVCNIVHSIIHTMKTPQNAVTFLLEAGGTSLVGVWRKVCGRRVTRGWSDHAVNCDSISQGALQQQLKKPLAA